MKNLIALLSLSLCALAAPAHAQVIINELYAPTQEAVDFNADGSAAEAEDAFVELVNLGDVPANVSQWWLSNPRGRLHTIPDGTVLAPGQALVVFGGGSLGNGLATDVLWQVANEAGLAFDAAGDYIILMRADNLPESWHQFEGLPAGSSLSRLPDGTGPWGDHGAEATVASPGRQSTGDAFSVEIARPALRVVSWNIEWFGHPSNGPEPEDTQKGQVLAHLKALDAPLYALQEVASEALLAELVEEMPGYAALIGSAVSNPPSDPLQSQKLVLLYDSTRLTVKEHRPLMSSIHPLYNDGDASALGSYPEDPDRFYASGRLPQYAAFELALADTTVPLHVVNLHARANSSSDAISRYRMRRFDVEALKDSLDAHFAQEPVLVLGDFNDDVDVTVASVAFTNASTYVAYTEDNAYAPGNDGLYYQIPTANLSARDERSYVFRDNMIDHVMVNSVLAPRLMNGAEAVHWEFVGEDFSVTTSDHVPVSTYLSYDNLMATVKGQQGLLPQEVYYAVGLEPDVAILPLTMYPNPAVGNGLLTIQWPSQWQGQTVLWKVRNLQGQVLAEGESVGNALVQVEAGLWQPGVYVVEGQSRKEKATGLWLVQ